MTRTDELITLHKVTSKGKAVDSYRDSALSALLPYLHVSYASNSLQRVSLRPIAAKPASYGTPPGNAIEILPIDPC